MLKKVKVPASFSVAHAALANYYHAGHLSRHNDRLTNKHYQLINTLDMTSFDQREFRNALGTFTTGITVITTTVENAEPVGITVNSFASVSLDPPLVLWCLDNEAYFFDIFAGCKNFAVHVLHQDQEATSQIFSTKNSSKFSRLDWEVGEFGSPILQDCASHFECEMESQCAGGDHIIILGRVRSFRTHKDKPPLIYHAGEYQRLKIR